MDRAEALKMLVEKQDDNDQEMAHVEADNVLCKLLGTLGYEDVVAEYNKIAKWYA